MGAEVLACVTTFTIQYTHESCLHALSKVASIQQRRLVNGTVQEDVALCSLHHTTLLTNWRGRKGGQQNYTYMYVTKTTML